MNKKKKDEIQGQYNILRFRVENFGDVELKNKVGIEIALREIQMVLTQLKEKFKVV